MVKLLRKCAIRLQSIVMALCLCRRVFCAEFSILKPLGGSKRCVEHVSFVEGFTALPHRAPERLISNNVHGRYAKWRQQPLVHEHALAAGAVHDSEYTVCSTWRRNGIAFDWLAARPTEMQGWITVLPFPENWTARVHRA